GELAAEAARLLGKNTMSAQAVGGAVGKNPISILIPCHRCIGAGGKLTGYAWGIEKKAWLLRHEGWKGM
ncbi:MAG: MGMT family protein, partial [Akkermansia sp.]|nr:MGMT family protein [Akkermansia sp.]